MKKYASFTALFEKKLLNFDANMKGGKTFIACFLCLAQKK
jgi:hypothetical protein